jgi:hypothetical protein
VSYSRAPRGAMPCDRSPHVLVDRREGLSALATRPTQSPDGLPAGELYTSAAEDMFVSTISEVEYGGSSGRFKVQRLKVFRPIYKIKHPFMGVKSWACCTIVICKSWLVPIAENASDSESELA